MVRCRANWVEMGEKPTGYFSNLEKCNRNSATICTLITQNGICITDQTAILNEENRFFKDLYHSRENDLLISATYLEGLELPCISEDVKLMLEEPLAIEEIIEATKALKNNKASGTDGICIEVYKKYMYILAATLLIGSWRHHFIVGENREGFTVFEKLASFNSLEL